MAVKSIIIGSNGYIGRNLAWYLTKKSEDVICYDINDTSNETYINYQKLNIINQAEVDDIDTNVDFIYLFAGLTGTSQGFDDFNSYVDINEKGLLNLLSTMRKQASKARLVFPSTRLVYKGQTGIALKEDAEKETKTLYAVNKLACEHILPMYKNAFDINYTIFRICVPYGNLLEGGFSYGTLGFFIQKACAGENISLFGDGSLRRSFTHVEDICNKITGAVVKEESNGKIYNIGGENLSLLDVAQQIAAKYGVAVEFTTWPALALKIESGDTIFDGKALNEICGDGFKHNLKTWLS